MKAHNVLFVAAAAAIVAVACSDDVPTLSAKSIPRSEFKADLTGAAEKPNAVTTTASGSSTITLMSAPRVAPLTGVDTTIVRVQTLVSDVQNRTTQAHIHAGDANTAGPIMVFLLSNISA